MTHQVTSGQCAYMRVALIQAPMATPFTATASCTVDHFPLDAFCFDVFVAIGFTDPQKASWLSEEDEGDFMLSQNGGWQNHQKASSRSDLCDVNTWSLNVCWFFVCRREMTWQDMTASAQVWAEQTPYSQTLYASAITANFKNFTEH